MPAPLDITTRTIGGGATLAVVGELDLSTLPTFVAAVDEVLAADVDVLTIDTDELSFADSSAIQALLHAQATATERRIRLQLVNVRGSLERTLDLAGLDDVFEIIGT
jgi:anti-sigma B factor antagonist